MKKNYFTKLMNMTSLRIGLVISYVTILLPMDMSIQKTEPQLVQVNAYADKFPCEIWSTIGIFSDNYTFLLELIRWVQVDNEVYDKIAQKLLIHLHDNIRAYSNLEHLSRTFFLTSKTSLQENMVLALRRIIAHPQIAESIQDTKNLLRRNKGHIAGMERALTVNHSPLMRAHLLRELPLDKKLMKNVRGIDACCMMNSALFVAFFTFIYVQVYRMTQLYCEKHGCSHVSIPYLIPSAVVLTIAILIFGIFKNTVVFCPYVVEKEILEKFIYTQRYAEQLKALADKRA